MEFPISIFTGLFAPISMAATRAKRTGATPGSSSDDSFYLGVPKILKTLPTWERILLLTSTYKPTDESRDDEGKKSEEQPSFDKVDNP